MSESTTASLIYFVELYTYIIPNVPNHVQTQKNHHFIQLMVCFLWSPVNGIIMVLIEVVHLINNSSLSVLSGLCNAVLDGAWSPSREVVAWLSH